MFIDTSMRYLKLIAILFVLGGVVVPRNASAQEQKHVEVTTIYTPEVESVKKLDVPASVAEGADIEPEINYNVTPETWQIKLQDHNFKPAKASYWDFSRAEHCYTRLASGYPLISDAELRYMIQNVRVGYLGVGVDHKGRFSPKRNGVGVERSIADSYDMQNRAYFHGGAVAGKRMFESSLDYNFDIYNRYAVVESPSRLYFNDANLAMRFGDNFSNLSRMNFNIELHGGYWSHVPPMAAEDGAIPEFSAGASLQLKRDFKGNVVGFGAEYDMWQSTASSYRDIRFGADVEYARDFGVIAVDASIGYLYDKVRNRDEASHFIPASLRLDFNVGLEALRPYIDAGTTVSQNGVAQLYRANPYLDYDYSQATLLEMPNTRSYNISGGFTGKVFASRLTYRAYVGVSFLRDQVLWYINRVGCFGVATTDNSRLAFGAEVDYRPVGGLSIGAMFYAHLDNTKSDYAISDARMRGSFDIKYNIKRWQFYLSGDLTGRRSWSAITAEGIDKEAYVTPVTFDLGVGISCRVTRKIEVFVDGYNLLNQDIINYAYYERNGIGCMAGVKIDF